MKGKLRFNRLRGEENAQREGYGGGKEREKQRDALPERIKIANELLFCRWSCYRGEKRAGCIVLSQGSVRLGARVSRLIRGNGNGRSVASYEKIMDDYSPSSRLLIQFAWFNPLTYFHEFHFNVLDQTRVSRVKFVELKTDETPTLQILLLERSTISSDHMY